MGWQQLVISIELTLGTGETVQDDSLLGLRLLELFLNDANNNVIVHKSTRVNDVLNFLCEGFVEGAGGIALQNLSDLVTCRDMVVLEIL
jgi:hypothetical protein